MSQTREDWIRQMIRAVTPIFTEAGARVPPRIGCICAVFDWERRPSWLAGQCIPVHMGNGIPYVLISPSQSDPLEVSSTIVHELVHACLDCRGGHGEPFQELAAKVGLVAPWTYAPAGEVLKRRLSALVECAGRYPVNAGKRVFIETEYSKLEQVLNCYRTTEPPPPKPKLPPEMDNPYPIILHRRLPGSDYGTARILIENVYQYHELLEWDDLARGEWKFLPARSQEDLHNTVRFDAYLRYISSRLYPKMKFHPTLGMKTVATRAEEKLLGPEWSDKPSGGNAG